MSRDDPNEIDPDVAMLAELAELAMDMARIAHAHAAVDPVAATGAFAKAARTVRLTLSLKQKVADHAEVKAQDSPEMVRRSAEVKSAAGIVAAFVGHALELEDRYSEFDRMTEDLVERLEREGESFLIDEPIQTVIQNICDGLRVPTPWAAADNAKGARDHPPVTSWNGHDPP